MRMCFGFQKYILMLGSKFVIQVFWELYILGISELNSDFCDFPFDSILEGNLGFSIDPLA